MKAKSVVDVLYCIVFIFPPYSYIVTWDSSINNVQDQYKDLSICLSTRFKSRDLFE